MFHVFTGEGFLHHTIRYVGVRKQETAKKRIVCSKKITSVRLWPNFFHEYLWGDGSIFSPMQQINAKKIHSVLGSRRIWDREDTTTRRILSSLAMATGRLLNKYIILAKIDCCNLVNDSSKFDRQNRFFTLMLFLP
ncbi:MAG: hypothetical protein WAO19_09455 [Candidatus Kryptoniota bacterium]